MEKPIPAVSIQKEESTTPTIAETQTVKGDTITIISDHSTENKKVNAQMSTVHSHSDDDDDETEDEAENIDAHSQTDEPKANSLSHPKPLLGNIDDQSTYANFNAFQTNPDANTSENNSSSNADLLSAKLATASASAANQDPKHDIDLDMLRNMVQARAASNAQGMMHPPPAFNGNIDPNLLNKALALGNQSSNQLDGHRNKSTYHNQNQNNSVKREPYDVSSNNLATKAQQQSMAANLLGLQNIGDQTSASMQALKDAAAGMQQSDISMEEQQNASTASNGNQGISLTPALMSLFQNTAQEGHSASYMNTLQQLLKRQQQGMGDISNIRSSPVSANNAFPPSFPNNSISATRTSQKLPLNLGLPGQDNNISDKAGGDYRDFSKMCNNDANDFHKNQPPGKEPPFPVKLHRILSNPEYSDIVSWLPHGRSWRVLKPKAFEEKVIPIFFRHAKYASFMRQVNGWGFKRMTQGPDHNSYYHELFLRGMPHLCYKMRRPTRARVDTDPDFNPDFYRLSVVAPLPDDDGNGFNTNVPGANGMNHASIPSHPSNNILQNAGGLASLAGMGNMNGLAGMNMGMHGVDNVLTSNLLQQQLQQNQNSGMGQYADLSQGLQNGGNNLAGLQNGNSEQDQLEALRLRREELVSQLQRMAGNNNTSNIMGAGVQGMNSNHNGNGLLHNNAGNNAFMRQNGLGNMGAMGSLLNQSLGSNPSAQLQQMMGLGGMNGGSQSSMLSNSGAFGSNQTNGGLNMNNLSCNFPNGLPSNLSGNLGNNLNNFGGRLGGVGGGMSGLNQQLLMHNGMGGSGSGMSMHNNMGLGGMNNNMMSQNLEAMLQANQLMGQQGNYGMPSDGNHFGDNNPPSSSV